MKINLTAAEKILIFEIIGIEEINTNGQKVTEARTYPLGQLVDADSLIKKLITKGVPFTETVQFNDGEIELTPTELALLKREVKNRQSLKLSQKDSYDSIVAKLKSVV